VQLSGALQLALRTESLRQLRRDSCGGAELQAPEAQPA